MSQEHNVTGTQELNIGQAASKFKPSGDVHACHSYCTVQPCRAPVAINIVQMLLNGRNSIALRSKPVIQMTVPFRCAYRELVRLHSPSRNCLYVLQHSWRGSQPCKHAKLHCVKAECTMCGKTVMCTVCTMCSTFGMTWEHSVYKSFGVQVHLKTMMYTVSSCSAGVAILFLSSVGKQMMPRKNS